MWSLFAIDYAVRVSLAQQRGRFIRRHLPDLLVIVLLVIVPPLLRARCRSWSRCLSCTRGRSTP